MSMFRPYLVNPASYLHRVHLFFLSDFSTKVAFSGTQSTSKEMAKRPLDAHCSPNTMYTSTGVDRREPPYFCDKLRKANEIKFYESCSVEYTTLETKRNK